MHATPAATVTVGGRRVARSAAVGLCAAAVLAVAALGGCLSGDSPELWNPEVKDRIHKVTIPTLLAEVSAEADNILRAEPPVLRQDDWTVRQTVAQVIRDLNESLPNDMFVIEERLARLGLLGRWYELVDDKGNPRPPGGEWILWIHEPFGKYSGSGMYFYRFPTGNPLAVGAPAGFDSSRLAVRAVELFLQNRDVATLALGTPARTPPRPPKAKPEWRPAPAFYQTWAESWMTGGSEYFWLDLATYPKVAATENLYLGAVTLASNGRGTALSGRPAEVVRNLLDAGLTVETLGQDVKVAGLQLPPTSAAIAAITRHTSGDYLLLAFPTTALEPPATWLGRVSKGLPAAAASKRKNPNQP